MGDSSENTPRPTHRRGNPRGCPSPLLNRETRNRRSLHALPQFDKQERMSHTIHKRLPAAPSHDNEEMARYGANTTKENHAASPTCPVSSVPGEDMNFTITRKMQQNATPCNKFPKNPRLDEPSPLPVPHASCHYPENNPGQPPVGATLVVALLLRQYIFIPGGEGGNLHEIFPRRARPVPRYGAGIHRDKGRSASPTLNNCYFDLSLLPSLLFAYANIQHC